MYYEQLKNSLQVYKIPLLSLINRSRLHLLSLCVHIESNRSSIINLSVLLCIISSREPKTINREQRTRKKWILRSYPKITNFQAICQNDCFNDWESVYKELTKILQNKTDILEKRPKKGTLFWTLKNPARWADIFSV